MFGLFCKLDAQAKEAADITLRFIRLPLLFSHRRFCKGAHDGAGFVDDSIRARVRSALTELLPEGAGSIEDAAEKSGLSGRTLQRKLAEKKAAFQKQLNSTREILAIHYMQNTNMSTHDMAYLPGHAELNSFLRAFKVWIG